MTTCNICDRIVESSNFYDALGLERGCTEGEIRSAFVKLVRTVHPDRNRAENAKKACFIINDAYKTLSDKEEREKYNHSMDIPSNPLHGFVYHHTTMEFSSMEDLLKKFGLEHEYMRSLAEQRERNSNKGVMFAPNFYILLLLGVLFGVVLAVSTRDRATAYVFSETPGYANTISIDLIPVGSKASNLHFTAYITDKMYREYQSWNAAEKRHFDHKLRSDYKLLLQRECMTPSKSSFKAEKTHCDFVFPRRIKLK
ncbi:hypothetical protein PCE1_003696 [Barthelona sp. PCE]